MFEKCLNELSWDIEDLDEGYNLYDLCCEEMCVVEQIYQDNYKEKYDNLKEEYIEANWDYYFRDKLIENVENTLDEIKNHIDDCKEDFR